MDNSFILTDDRSIFLFLRHLNAMKRLLTLILFSILLSDFAIAQSDNTNRSTIYMTYGRTGSNLREFNQMLENKGLSPMRKSYSNLSFGYLTRFQDFIVGFEVFQNHGPSSHFNGFEIDYHSTRMYLNVGFAFTEEGRFQFVHYMSIGMGFLNFEMMPTDQTGNLESFLNNPNQGFILRDGNMHKGTFYATGFLTEIGFQASYDFYIPGRDEMFEIMARFGYSFSPFENSWNLNGISFNSLQSGPFIRVGAGITIPDQNFFYRDASIGAHFFYSQHFTRPDALNRVLEENGYMPFTGRPNNWGLKILGESQGFLYGIDFFNLGLSGKANETKSHTLNSLRVYGTAGQKFFEFRNLELGGTVGLGFANLRYTLTNDQKPDFPRLFEEPLHDGSLMRAGIMTKPELMFSYGIPFSKKYSSKVLMGIGFGYEIPLTAFNLGGLSMTSYMSNPYLQFSIGVRP